MRHWLGQTRENLAEFMAAGGQPAYRTEQFRDWLHAKRADVFDAMLNLPADLRQTLARAGCLRSLRELERRRTPDMLTVKWLFAAADPGALGEALIESVLIIEKERRRRTVCVSSMAGCPLGCVFCATGRTGFVRDLDAGEMVEQVYRAAAFLDRPGDATGEGGGVSHIVFMGMGEPLLNLDAVLTASSLLADPAGLGLSGRRITISTAGVPDGIRRLARIGVNYRLALSLHAPNQSLREKLLPSAARWRLDDVMAAVREFAAGAARDVTFEYCLVDGVNASPREAGELARLLSGLRAKVNLIPLNPVAGYDERAPSPGRVGAFRDILEKSGVPATIRVEKGREIGAACGQLRAERLDKG